MEAVVGVEGDVVDGEGGELGTAERPHPAHHQQTPVPDRARRGGPAADVDAGDELLEVGEKQRRLSGAGVARLRRIPARVSRTCGSRPGATSPARSWALLMVATHRARVAGLYRHGTDRPVVAVALAASAHRQPPPPPRPAGR